MAKFFRKLKQALVMAGEPGGITRLSRLAFWKFGPGVLLKQIRGPMLTTSILSLLADRKSEVLFIFRPMIAWNVPLAQRPHHLARRLSRYGTYLFCTSTSYDGEVFLRKISDGLYISSYYNQLRKILLQNAGDFGQLVFHCYAHDTSLGIDEIQSYLDRGAVVLYEYIDALHDDLTSGVDSIRERHAWALRNEHILVVVTAKHLLSEVETYRKRNYLAVPNGVDYEHFQNLNMETLPSADLFKERVVIGYFGAFASWFDYKLLVDLAQQRPHWQFLLIGWDFDGSLKEQKDLLSQSNIKIMGPIKYEQLPTYARAFDVGIIPFVVNEVTLATNPIKMYEYFALGLPVVSSHLPECMENKRVVTAEGSVEWLKRLDDAVGMAQDAEYRREQREEAMRHNWDARSEQVFSLIQQGIDKGGM